MSKKELIDWLMELSPDKTEKDDLTRLESGDFYEVSLVESGEVGSEFVIQKQADSEDMDKTGDNNMSEIEKSINTKREIEKEIDTLAERLSNKKGIDMSLAKEKVLEENVDLYAAYKSADKTLQSKSWDKLAN